MIVGLIHDVDSGSVNTPGHVFHSPDLAEGVRQMNEKLRIMHDWNGLPDVATAVLIDTERDQIVASP